MWHLPWADVRMRVVDCFRDVGSLNVHIRWLREKLEEDPRNPRLIRTVWRVGYQFGGSGV